MSIRQEEKLNEKFKKVTQKRNLKLNFSVINSYLLK